MTDERFPDVEPKADVPPATKRGIGHLTLIQSLPDNVYILRPREPLPPEAA
jgi:hypothetical protein